MDCRTTEAADFSDELEKTAHRHVAVAGRAFGQITDLPLGLQGLGANVVAEDARRARRRREKAGQHLHSGGLAGTIRAEKSQHLAALDLE